MPARDRAAQGRRPDLEEGRAKGRERLGRRGELTELEVEDVDASGASTGGLRVRGVLPSERVLARIDHAGKRGIDFGSVVEILRASPDRRPSVCPHFLACGGCDLLHADLSLQHALKRRAVAAALGLPIERVEPVVASPKSLGYRALAKLVVSGGVLGSYAPRSHDVVSMEGCPIHDPSVEAIAAAIRVWLRSTEAPHLRHVLIRGSLQERRSIVTIVRWSRDEAASLLARHLGDRSDVARVVVHTNDDAGDALIGAGPSEVPIDRGAPLERIGPIELSLESGAFAQVNPAAAAKLYALVGEMIAPEGKAIADLYSGSGGIALTLEAMGAASVAGVESVEAAVVAARRSSRGRASFACADAASHPIGPVDAVVLNPPRKGAPEGLLRRLSHVPLIVYVSCHPPSLARDLAILGSHRLDRVVPVDMFPQTRHIETVVRLVRA